MAGAVITSNVCQTLGRGPRVMLQQPWGHGYSSYLTAVFNLFDCILPLTKQRIHQGFCPRRIA